MKALVVERLPQRFAAARIAAAVLGSGSGVAVGPLRLLEIDPPALPAAGWRRLRPRLAGICGSDLSTLDGTSSRYFEPIVTFPFVPGHEVVGELVDGPDAGARVVIEPVLGCAARGIEPPCAPCASGHKDRCENLTLGHIHPGLQTGYCADTGGGWSEELVVHESQLRPVPDGLSDEAAVIIEPTACAVHAVLRADVTQGERVIVLGAGTLGLLCVAALRQLALPAALLAVARHPVQRDLAATLGADQVVAEDDLPRAARRLSASVAVGRKEGRLERLGGGADVVFDCVGSSASLAQSLAVTRPGGRIVLVGMPSTVHVDLAPLWQRQVSLLGTYAYGTEEFVGRVEPTFTFATELVAAAHLERLVTARYPLERYEDAVRHAANAGKRGAVKVAFDLRRNRSWQTGGA
ncbi:MAG TPA: zinc-binding dehydrogenase [Acidimicrobiales bacterium]|nr:zinc-binding dehydrogenase [Acidimicrobiales bacterium]